MQLGRSLEHVFEFLTEVGAPASRNMHPSSKPNPSNLTTPPYRNTAISSASDDLEELH